MSRSILTEIDSENWRFTLYQANNGKYYADFPYSPVSFVDLSMLIELDEYEKTMAQNDRQFLRNLSETIKNNFNAYLPRALNRNDFQFIDR